MTDSIRALLSFSDQYFKQNTIKEDTIAELVNSQSIESYLYIVGALARSKIDPDDLLILTITNFRSFKDLNLIGLALRYGASPNLYVSTNDRNSKVIHILAYLWLDSRKRKVNPKIFFKVFQLLLVAGGNLQKPVFSTGSESETSYFPRTRDAISVREWIEQEDTSNQRYGKLQDVKDIYSGLNLLFRKPTLKDIRRISIDSNLESSTDPFTTLFYFSLLLDKPEVVVEEEEALISPVSSQLFSNPEAGSKGLTNLSEDVYKSLFSLMSINMLKFLLPRLTFTLNFKDKYLIPGLRYSSMYLFLSAWEELEKYGLIPSYLYLTQLIARMNFYYRSKIYLPEVQIREMILSSIRRGARLNSYQIGMIEGLRVSGESSRYLQIYRVPFWRKICEVVDQLPQAYLEYNLKDLIIVDPVLDPKYRSVGVSFRLNKAYKKFSKIVLSLGLDPEDSPEELCRQLQEMSSIDPETLINSFRDQQQKKILLSNTNPLKYVQENNLSSEIESIGESVDSVGPCSNSMITSKTPYDFADPLVSSYTSKSGNTFCYMADNYESLEEEQEDPITGEQLPDFFLNTIKEKRTRLAKYDQDPSDLLSFPEALEALEKVEDVEMEDAELLQKQQIFSNIAKIYGYPFDKFYRLSSKFLTSVLNQIGIQMDLESLPASYAKVIFSNLIVDINNFDDFGDFGDFEEFQGKKLSSDKILFTVFSILKKGRLETPQGQVKSRSRFNLPKPIRIKEEIPDKPLDQSPPQPQPSPSTRIRSLPSSLQLERSRSEVGSEIGSEVGSEVGSEIGSEVESEVGSKDSPVNKSYTTLNSDKGTNKPNPSNRIRFKPIPL